MNVIYVSLLLASAVIGITNALSCLPGCDKSLCEPLDCPGSEVPGLCRCCNRCAKQEGETCGGDFTLQGICDTGLSCGNPEPQVMPGLITLTEMNRGGTCMRHYGSCQEACTSTGDDDMHPVGFSRRGRSALLNPNPNDDSKGYWAYCDCSDRNQAWTVIQRRELNSENFDRSYYNYQMGFGYSTSDYWLGLDKIHELTKRTLYEMKVVVKYDNRRSRSETMFPDFSIGNSTTMYKLSVSPSSQSASRAFVATHNGMGFSANGQDNDLWSAGDCAKMYGGGWWFNRCSEHNLNGRLYGVQFMLLPPGLPPPPTQDGPDRISWDYSTCKRRDIKAAEIWIRPRFVDTIVY